MLPNVNKVENVTCIRTSCWFNSQIKASQAADNDCLNREENSQITNTIRYEEFCTAVSIGLDGLDLYKLLLFYKKKLS